MSVPTVRSVAASRTLAVAAVALAVPASWSGGCLAQDAVAFPPIASGFDQDLGITVQTRPRPLYDPLGIEIGTIVIMPSLNQSIGYESNPTGSAAPVGTAVAHTAASVAAAMTRTDVSLGVQLGADHYDYLNLAGTDYTDWNAGVRGSLGVDGDELMGAYVHQDYHQLGASIGTVRSDTPTADHTDSAQLGYMKRFERFDLTPDVSFSAYRYGIATEGAVAVDQRYLDRNVVAGGLTGRYTITDIAGLVAVAQTTDAHYLHRLAGLPSNNSRDYMLLTGVDYQLKGPFRYRVLVGGEVSTFSAAQYATRVTPVVEANVTWTPTGLATVTGVLKRAIADPLAADTNGNIATSGSVRVDYEFLRNLILEAQGGAQLAQFLTRGSQTSFDVGTGAELLLNRDVKLSLSYAFTHQSAASGVGGGGGIIAPDSASFNQNVVELTLQLAL